MNLLIALIVTASLDRPSGAETPAGVPVFEIPEVEATFTQDEQNPIELVENPKIEVNDSFSNLTNSSAATLAQTITTDDEIPDTVHPQLEDLSLLAKRPTVTITTPEPTEAKNPYETLPVTITDKQKIGSILTIMAQNNVFKLLFEKQHLEKLGREINHVHPIRFLGVVFSDPRLVHCMFEIRRSGFKWDGFIDGFSKRFDQEYQANNINAYIPGLANSLKVQANDLMAYVNYNDFEGLVLYLMEKSQQK